MARRKLGMLSLALLSLACAQLPGKNCSMKDYGTKHPPQEREDHQRHCILSNSQLKRFVEDNCTSADYVCIDSCPDCSQDVLEQLQLRSIYGKDPLYGNSIDLATLPKIRSLEPFQSVRCHLLGALRIEQMDLLVNLWGLHGLFSLGLSKYKDSLKIAHNPKLRVISALGEVQIDTKLVQAGVENPRLACAPASWPEKDMNGRTIRQQNCSITIGGTVSLSGKYRLIGQEMKRGYELWCDHVNKAPCSTNQAEKGLSINGSCFGVELDLKDDASQPGKVFPAYTDELLDSSDLLVAPYTSGLTQSASAAVNGAMPMLAAFASDESLFLGNKHLYSLLSSAESEAKSALSSFKSAATSASKAQNLTVALMTQKDSPFAVKCGIGAETFITQEPGLKLVAHLYVKEGQHGTLQQTVQSALSNIKNEHKHLDLLMISAAAALVHPSINALAVTKLQTGATIINNDLRLSSMRPEQQTRNNSQYWMSTSWWHPSSTYSAEGHHLDRYLGADQNQGFISEYKQKYGMGPSTYSARAAAVTTVIQKILDQMINQSRFVSPFMDARQFRAAFNEAAQSLDADTFWGRVQFNAQNMNEKAAPLLLQVQDHRREETVIDPARSESLIFPAPWQWMDGKPVQNCSEVLKGHYCSASRTSFYQIGCEEGTYSDEAAKEPTASCKICPAAYFASGIAQTACQQCDRGQYSKERAAGCTGCQDVTKAIAQCTNCFPGKVRKTGAACEPCAAGFFQDDTTALHCEACPRGYVQPLEGKGFCNQCAFSQYVKLDEKRRPDNKTCVKIPRKGVVAADGTRKYIGAVWHDPALLNPDESTSIYTCVNDGCPDEGADAMECKDGYRGPLCALCDEGYVSQRRSCEKCGQVRWGAFSAFVLSILAVAGLVIGLLYKYRRYADKMNVFPYVKVIISFLTISVTVETQFGVIWPPGFVRVLDALSVLSIDFGALAGAFCFVDVGFYETLVFTTISLAVVVGAILFCALRAPPKSLIRERALFAAVYLALFAYPLVSVKVVASFLCHHVNIFVRDTGAMVERSFLREDYDIDCESARWRGFCAYSTFWVVFYVIFLPVFLFVQLHKTNLTNRHRLATDRRITSMFAFLADDYKEGYYFWDVLEMGRKLSLSVTGAFWSTKSSAAVATVFMISCGFLLLHLHCRPYANPAVGRLQALELTILTLIYFLGLCIKTSIASTEAPERDYMAVLLVVLVVAVFAACAAAAAWQVAAVMEWFRTVKYAVVFVNESSDFDPQLAKHVIDPQRIKLGRLLGSGAEGDVYKGVYDGNDVAVKIHKLDMYSCTPGVPIQEKLNETQLEAKRLVGLRHPNIISFLGISIRYHDDGEIHVLNTMELMAGSLADHIFVRKGEKTRKNTLNRLQSLKVCLKLSGAMHYIHSKRMYHRDLKPANVLLDETASQVKLTDFGLSKTVTATLRGGGRGSRKSWLAPKPRRQGNHALATHTANIGTPVYMAPELMINNTYVECNPQLIDVYSFGVLIWAIMTGTKPYDAEVRKQRMSMWDLRTYVIGGGRPPVEGNPNIEGTPVALVRLMQDCWDADTAARLASFEAVQSRLARIVEEETATPGGGAKVGQVESGAVGVGGGGEGGSAGGGGGRAASDSNPLQLGMSRVQHHVL